MKTNCAHLNLTMYNFALVFKSHREFEKKEKLYGRTTAATAAADTATHQRSRSATICWGDERDDVRAKTMFHMKIIYCC